MPAIVKFSKPTNDIQLPLHGQCTFLFSLSNSTVLSFLNKDGSDGFHVSVSPKDGFRVKRIQISDSFPSQITASTENGTKSGAYFWFSLDSQNQCLQGGIGEPRSETVVYKYQWVQDKLWEANKIFLESLTHITVDSNVTPLRLLKNPITSHTPLKIKDTSAITMVDVAQTEFLPNAALSPSAQILYNSISGPKFTLNTPDFPDFSDAIEYSIKTEGCWCNTRLKEKAREFGKEEPLETYLRITLGQNNGESPGIPYVMEIWPAGHYSPIHNHSEANAIIRVLTGQIQVSLFPFLCDEPATVKPFAITEFVQEDITWLSPSLNQVHQLKNTQKSTTCITIQCYMYDGDDTKHYDYFDYLGDNNVKSQYEPDSDMEFLKFKETIRKEWVSHKILNSRPKWWCC